MKEIRHTIKLILTTDLSNEEIAQIVGFSSNIVGRCRQKVLTKKADFTCSLLCASSTKTQKHHN